jgi:hypothetical protein
MPTRGMLRDRAKERKPPLWIMPGCPSAAHRIRFRQQRKSPGARPGRRKFGELGPLPSYIRRSGNVDTHHVHGRVVSLHWPSGNAAGTPRCARAPGPHALWRHRSSAATDFPSKSPHNADSPATSNSTGCAKSPIFPSGSANGEGDQRPKQGQRRARTIQPQAAQAHGCALPPCPRARDRTWTGAAACLTI